MEVLVTGRRLGSGWLSLGVQGDNHVELVRFRLPRYTSAGVDLYLGIPSVILELQDGTTLSVPITDKDKEKTDEELFIRWVVGSQATAQTGSAKLALKVSGAEEVLWSSEVCNCTVASTIKDPSPQPVAVNQKARKARIANPDGEGSPETSSSSEPPFIVVERDIQVPSVLRNIAVAHDRDSEKVHFVLPRYFDKNDHSTKRVFLKTILPNNNGRDDLEFTDTMEVSESELSFWWTLRPPQTSYAGNVQLQIYIIQKEGEAPYKWESNGNASVTILPSLGASVPTPLPPAEFYNKQTLDEKFAGSTQRIDHVEAETDSLRRNINEVDEKFTQMGMSTYTHRKEGTVHQLSGSGKHLAFLVTADYLPGESFTVNGQPVAAVTLDGYPLPAGSFVAGVWVLAVLDGERLNFQFRAKLGDGTGLTWGELDSL